MRRRQSALSMCLLAGLLLPCLACLEIPEMSVLKDDVSNDFTVLRTASAHSAAVIEVRAADGGTNGLSTVPTAVPASSPASQFPSGRTPRDPLVLHSLWRT